MSQQIRVFEVGGTIRDSFLGFPNKDRDFSVEAPSWEAMRKFVHSRATKVFLEKPEFLTIRALVPDEVTGKPDARDFVLCRKDGAYGDGRRPDSVKMGTILDDLARRDFTMNAMAKDVVTGELIDPFRGQDDIRERVLRCVGSAAERFDEDALRILRAMRFKLTKDLLFTGDILDVFAEAQWAERLAAVSVERIREEVRKCFLHDTPATLRFLSSVHPAYTDAIFSRGLWLDPSLKQR